MPAHTQINYLDSSALRGPEYNDAVQQAMLAAAAKQRCNMQQYKMQQQPHQQQQQQQPHQQQQPQLPQRHSEFGEGPVAAPLPLSVKAKSTRAASLPSAAAAAAAAPSAEAIAVAAGQELADAVPEAAAAAAGQMLLSTGTHSTFTYPFLNRESGVGGVEGERACADWGCLLAPVAAPSSVVEDADCVRDRDKEKPACAGRSSPAAAPPATTAPSHTTAADTDCVQDLVRGEPAYAEERGEPAAPFHADCMQGGGFKEEPVCIEAGSPAALATTTPSHTAVVAGCVQEGVQEQSACAGEGGRAALAASAPSSAADNVADDGGVADDNANVADNGADVADDGGVADDGADVADNGADVADDGAGVADDSGVAILCGESELLVKNGVHECL